MAWRENRNDKVLIKHATILVSSSTMSQLSPEFYKLFTTQDGSLRTCVELPDEDPMAFSMICESAHGSFVPHDQISLQTLAHIANAIQRYKIPTTSRVRHTTEFTFTVYASRLDTLTTIELLALLGVAKALGITRYKKLLEDAFLLYPLQFEALHMEHVAGGCDTDCAILGMHSASTNIRRLTKSPSKSKATRCGMPRTSGNHTVELTEQRLHSLSEREMRLGCVDSEGQP